MQNTYELIQNLGIRPLREYVKSTLSHYFQQLEGEDVINLYDLVLGEVEPPLIKAVMQYVRGNQSKAAILLGISRSTLRKKLKQYQGQLVVEE
jgi:DNA-binding protein Fis